MAAGIIGPGAPLLTSPIIVDGTYTYKMPQGRRLNTLIISGTFGAGTVQVSFSFDGVNFGPNGAAITAPAAVIYGSGAYVSYVRLVLTGSTAASIVAQAE